MKKINSFNSTLKNQNNQRFFHDFALNLNGIHNYGKNLKHCNIVIFG